MFIGLDIGGTNIKAIIRNQDEIISQTETKTPVNEADILVASLDLVDSLINRARITIQDIQKIGLAVAGIIDLKYKKIIKSPNKPSLNGSNLAVDIQKKLKVTVELDNDANCFLLGEVIQTGFNQRYQNILGITLGSGVGGGIWLNNQIYHGENGSAAEFGWMVVGQRKSGMLFFEEVCSQKWFLKNFQKESVEIYSLAKTQDKTALNIWRNYGENLGISLANLINIFDPGLIILGGGISRAVEFFNQPMKNKVQELVIFSKGKNIKIITSQDPFFSGAIGASYLG